MVVLRHWANEVFLLDWTLVVKNRWKAFLRKIILRHLVLFAGKRQTFFAGLGFLAMLEIWRGMVGGVECGDIFGWIGMRLELFRSGLVGLERFFWTEKRVLSLLTLAG
jgi:hypothetical protein